MRCVRTLLLLPVCLAATPIYRVVDLGGLGGGSSAATSITSRGVAAGWSVTGSQSLRAFLSDGSFPVSLDSPSYQGRAMGINDAGAVAGIRFDAYGNAQAMMWAADGSVSVLGGADSYAMAINAGGAVAGAQSGHAVRFDPLGGTMDIGVNSPWSAANAINDVGSVAGTAQLSSGTFRAFTTRPSTGVVMLGTLGGRSSYGQAINSAGWVAGGSTTARGYLHAFLQANGRMQDLGTLGGGNSSAYGVNDAGQVVGYSQIAGGDSSAFLWENGQLRDLNQLIAADTGWRLLEASAINASGQIVGFGSFGGEQRAFRLDRFAETAAQSFLVADAMDPGPGAAVPEPNGAGPLLAVGAVGIVFGGFRRRWFAGYFN